MMTADSDASTLASNGRRHGRHRVMLSARLYSVHGESSAVLLDLSRSGAMLSATPPLPRGCKLLLVRQGLEADATVIWTEGNRFGIAFDQMLTEEHVERLALNRAMAGAH